MQLGDKDFKTINMNVLKDLKENKYNEQKIQDNKRNKWSFWRLKKNSTISERISEFKN